MNRRRPLRQGTLPYSHEGSRRTSCTVTSASCSPAVEYYKDVILLPSPTWMKVDEGETINHNYKSVDATLMLFVFSKVMSEDEVKSKINYRGFSGATCGYSTGDVVFAGSFSTIIE